MFPKIKAAGLVACAILLGSVFVTGQDAKAQKPAEAASRSVGAADPATVRACAGCELPVLLRQNVEAGKTAVGSKVEAQLIMATMINGGVIPRGAVISGEVVESVAKSDKSPSRLGIRMDSAQWKNGGAKLKAYFTAWYYPPAPMAAPNLSYDTPGTHRNWGGVDYTDPPNPMSGHTWDPHPDADNGMNAATPASSVSKDRVVMKNVESARGSDGSIVLVSSKSNIKLNKMTTYMLVAGETLPGK